MFIRIIGCMGGFPGPDSPTSSYLVKKDDYLLVLDLGSGALMKIFKYVKVTEIDAVILSHYHHDHIADVGVLQYAKLVSSFLEDDVSILPIYGYPKDEKFQSLTSDYTKGIAFDPKQILTLGPFTISFLQTIHPVPCFGMRISDGTKEIVYTADSAYDSKWIDFAKRADLLIADCNFYADQDGTEAGHMTSEEVGYIAENAQVKHLILSHLPQYGTYEKLVEEASREYSGKISLAEWIRGESIKV